MIPSTGSNPFEQFGLRTDREARSGTGSNELGQEQFLKLMIAQFQNQDPFDPMENGEFLGQLAQFSTVSGINELKDGFFDLAGAMQSSQALQASGLVGSTVLVEAGQGFMHSEIGMSGAVKLDNSANDVVVDILDQNGERVRRLHLGPQSEGLARFHWDGLDDQGQAVEPGLYSAEAGVVRGGTSESGQMLINHLVESVTLDRGGRGVNLNTAAGGFRLGDVHEFL
ncbi:flagellar hook assembly protein FlgD [Natronospira bacteriovora]|uniref:Basal-body rod modification protein FlgD n=1 Tax=Natronospira bacteriovora TaxID=3069753 RepID=A0ABU0W3A3_9GAMM|nr:flagellar hook assembly protein FlgD [Natronospira sp. AB-CW4]MDQ2068493.1 flagellar hook assembly protein FlgD [Natronospira sp. AB-CW4]